jgi:hypothetical protein
MLPGIFLYVLNYMVSRLDWCLRYSNNLMVLTFDAILSGSRS